MRTPVLECSSKVSVAPKMVKNTVVLKMFYAFLFSMIVASLLYYDLLREWHTENINQPNPQSQVQIVRDFVVQIQTKKKYGAVLENILTATKQPEPGHDIFFIDTTYMKRRSSERPFTSRQACAVESAGEKNFEREF